MGIVFVSGFGTVIAYYVMLEIEPLRQAAEFLRPLFRLFPAYNLGEGMLQLCVAYWERKIRGRDRYPLDWDVAGKCVLLNYTLWLPFFFLLLLLEVTQAGGSGGRFGRFLRFISGAWERFVLRCQGVQMYGDNSEFNDGLDRDDDVEKEREMVMRLDDEQKRNLPVIYAD